VECMYSGAKTNFSSIEDVENCQYRGGFRQKNESVEETLDGPDQANRVIQC
jgi:hypothetical protein